MRASLHYRVRAYHSGGFSCCRTGVLGMRASVVKVSAFSSVVRGLQSAGSVVVAHRLSCFVACGIFPDQRSNQCTLHCKVDS